MTTTSPIAVREYLTRVRTGLEDLPVSELDELLDDVRPHLLEIATELGGDARLDEMIERLGTPESYAAELRAAGEYPPPAASQDAAPRAGHRFLPRLAFWLLPLVTVFAFVGGGSASFDIMIHPGSGALVLFLVVPALVWSVWYVSYRGLDAVRQLPEVQWLSNRLDPDAPGARGAVLRYLRSLAPAWWLVSALFLLLLLMAALRRGYRSGFFFPGDFMLVLVVLAALVLIGGARWRSDRRWLWLAVPTAAFATGAGLALLSSLLYNGMQVNYYDASANAFPAREGELYYGAMPVHNVYAFDEAGEPLTDVFLYDHNGRPLEIPRPTCDEAGRYETAGWDNWYPHPRVTVEGHEMTRPAYGNPDGGYVESDDPYGDRAAQHCEESDEVPFSVAVPKTPEPESAASPTTKPSTTTTAAPR